MHAVDLLDASEDEVTNVTIVIAFKLLVVTSLFHDGSKPLFSKVVEVDVTCLLGLSFLVLQDAWSSKGAVGG
jgi:hypothetical protein